MFVAFLAFRFWSQTSIDLVKEMMEKGDVERAYYESSALLESTDPHPEILELHALCALRLSRSSEAVLDLTNLLSMSHNAMHRDRLTALRALAYLRTGDYYSALNNSHSFFAGNLIPNIQEAIRLSELPEQTETTIRRLVSLSPESPSILSKAADFYESVGKMHEFDYYLSKALLFSPGDGLLLSKRGNYLFCHLSDFKEAIALFAQCAPSSESCRSGLQKATHTSDLMASVRQSINSHDFSSALADIEAANSIGSSVCDSASPFFDRLHLINASVLRLANRLEDAYDLAESLIHQSPRSANLLLVRSDILLDAGDFTSAIDLYRNVLEIEPESREALDGLQKAEELLADSLSASSYSILGASPNASLDVIRALYKEAIRSWHPDLFQHPLRKRIAERRTRLINGAFESLLASSSV